MAREGQPWHRPERDRSDGKWSLGSAFARLQRIGTPLGKDNAVET